MNTPKGIIIRQIKEKEKEIRLLMYAVTEGRLTVLRTPPPVRDRALCAAAQAVCAAIKTFIETAQIE